LKHLAKAIKSFGRDFTQVVELDKKGFIQSANEEFYLSTGSSTLIIGNDFKTLCHGGANASVYESIMYSLSKGENWKGNIACKRKDKAVLWKYLIAVPKNEDSYMLYMEDLKGYNLLTTQKSANHNIDTLTGLRNGNKFNNDIFLFDSNHFLAIVDIDDFSNVTNYYGGELGNKAISCIVDRVTKDIRLNKYKIYRIGTDAFAFTCQQKGLDVKSKTENFTILMDSLFSEPFRINKTINKKKKLLEIPLSVTIGASVGTNKNIYNEAHLAYKRAKYLKCKSLYFVPEMKKTLTDFTENQMKTIEISEAIKSGRVTPVYQPIIDNKTGKIAKFECLARLVRADGSYIYPDDFLPVSKKIKLYEEITRLMIKKSFAMFNGREFPFSINLTKKDLLSPIMQDFIISQIEKFSNPKMITFELVEDEDLYSSAISGEHNFIDKLKSYGCKIAIDDFGAGYSNFNYLMHMGAEYLKFDKNYITLLAGNNIKSEQAKKAIYCIQEYAKSFGMKTVAEWVETSKLQAEVERLNIDYSQGYLHGKPLYDINFDEIR